MKLSFIGYFPYSCLKAFYHVTTSAFLKEFIYLFFCLKCMSFHKLMDMFTFLCFSNREQISRKKIMWVWIRVLTWKGWRIWGRHHYWWRAANFDLYSELRVIAQWGFLSVTHLILHGKYVYVVISEDMWHSHQLPSVKQWSCHYLIKW